MALVSITLSGKSKEFHPSTQPVRMYAADQPSIDYATSQFPHIIAVVFSIASSPEWIDVRYVMKSPT